MKHETVTTPGRVLEVWLVEDNQRFRENIEELVNETRGLRCIVAHSSCEEALERLMTDAAPDIMLMDIGLPGLDGIEGIRRVKSIAPSIQIIMLTVFDDSDKILQAICAGASGYLLKSASPDDIIRSLSDILNGGAPMNAQIARKVLNMFADMAAIPKSDYQLTNAERQILQLLVDGNPKKQIAHELNVSFHTVDTHFRNIYTKLQVHSRGEAVAKALKEKLV
ncbi:MAG TPA: response regulator transcription factor [Bacteroidota bacterium]|nr:response regulator transcription factor [Bacteroidota bacterium]